MGDYNFLLGKKRNKHSSNEHNLINVDLERDICLFPTDDVYGKVNQYQQYIKEKDKCTAYRLIFTINPVCSNVLFNPISEMVYKEGSDECVFFGVKGGSIDNIGNISLYHSYKEMDKKVLTRQDLIKDTAYTHPSIGPITYHCGYDIFNNHILRRKEFEVTNMLPSTDEHSDKRKFFNTLEDYNRYASGKYVSERNLGLVQNGKVFNLDKDKHISHQYLYDTVYSFPEAIKANLIEENGWFGFTNPVGISIPNVKIGNSGLTVNKCMNNNKACEMIDMYPDRSLYSFTPKFNKYRNRVEDNWKYCITYPFKNFYEHDLIQETVDSTKVKGIKCFIYSQPEEVFSVDGSVETKELSFDYDNGLGKAEGTKKFITAPNALIVFRTQLRHTLKYGDKIHLTIIRNNNNKVINVIEDVDVMSVGYNKDAEDYFFSVNAETLAWYLGEDDIVSHIDSFGRTYFTFNDEMHFRMRKVKTGKECDYYIRLFRKLPNLNKTDVYLNSQISEESIKKYLGRDFSTSLNNLAFSKNVYNDEVSQIIFNEDIQIKGFRDNLGRELSEVFLTIVKNNKGYEEWYNNKNYNSDEVEFSHCFGKITSGIDLPFYCDDYNVHKIHNVKIDEDDKGFITLKFFTGLEESPKSLGTLDNGDASEITITGDTFFTQPSYENDYGEYVFFGDIVEFEPYTINEVVLGDVNFRFNTAQREYTGYEDEISSKNKNPEFYNIERHEIVSDDLEVMDRKTGKKEDFKVSYSNTTDPPSEYEKTWYNYFNVNSLQQKPDFGEARKGSENMYPGNIFSEGYFYKAHYRIPLRSYSTIVQQGSHTNVTFKIINHTTDNKIEIKTPVNYYFTKGETIYLENRRTFERISCKITGVKGKTFTLIQFAVPPKDDNNEKINFDTLLENLEKGYRIFKINQLMPYTAYEFLDGTGRYLWRDFLSDSAVTTDDETYDIIFTNNKKYRYDNINFLLRRQDNEGFTEDSITKIEALKITNKEKNVSDLEYIEEDISTPC